MDYSDNFPLTEIPSIEIAKYYLKVELGKPFRKEESKRELNKFIYSLDDNELWKLLEIVSKEYRKNSIFELLFTSTVNWEQMIINVKDIKLSPVNNTVNPFLEQVNYDPIIFKDLLSRIDIDEFKPREVNKNEDIFIFTYIDGIYKIQDGIHRFMSLVQQGNIEVKGLTQSL